MTYAEFTTYLITFLWKTGDRIVNENIDSLVTMAEHELNRRLTINRRTTPLTPFVVTSETMDLPNDFRHMVYFGQETNNPDAACKFMNTTMWGLQNAPAPTTGLYPLYHTSGGKLYTKAASYPQNASLQYRANVPAFKETNASWLADDFLDLYAYTCLKHTSLFIREDERVAGWTALSEQALATALDEDGWEVEYGGSPLSLAVARQIP